MKISDLAIKTGAQAAIGAAAGKILYGERMFGTFNSMWAGAVIGAVTSLATYMGDMFILTKDSLVINLALAGGSAIAAEYAMTRKLETKDLAMTAAIGIGSEIGGKYALDMINSMSQPNRPERPQPIHAPHRPAYNKHKKRTLADEE